jgi:hypothetical protein
VPDPIAVFGAWRIVRGMHQNISWLIIAAIAGTLVVLVIGVLSMLRQGKFNARRSQKLMRFRILFQLGAIVLLAIAFLMNR